MSKQFKVKLVSSTKTQEEYIEDMIETLKGDDEVLPEEIKKLLEDKEGLMAYVARVSSPKQVNPKFAHLLRYCMKHGHWSVFEMCDATFEIETSRGISPQILRHRSFCFQEFSQRYAAVASDGIQIYEMRAQDHKNRQNSLDDVFTEEDQREFEDDQREIWELAYKKYEKWLSRDGAKECARFLLPLNTKTRLYMKGSIRSWIHYIDLRSANGTQKEHMEIAQAIKEIFVESFPIIAEAKGWKDEEDS